MNPTLRLLIIEDSEFDAHIMVSLVRKGGYEVVTRRVETLADLRNALTEGQWDVILADYNLPDFNAPAALETLQETGLDLPFIIVSGGIGEDTAVAAMKAGAHDYLMKGNLHRLVPAIERELREAGNRASQREAKRALQESEHRYRLLWETSPDAVILMDPECKVLFANPAVEAVFGYNPAEVIGQGLSLLQPERFHQSHKQAISQYLSTGIKKLNWRATETVGRRKDGVEIPIEVSFSHMQLQGEHRFVGFIRDISERKRAERELRENKEQFRVAREIQQRLFPKCAPILPRLDIAGASYPAEATGGDYFDYLPMLNGRWGLVVADVTGHGIGPALLMAETRAYLRVLAGRRENPAEILTRVNSVLAEDVGSERFVTMFLLRVDPRDLSYVYASAGHPAAFVLDAEGRLKSKLRCTGIPLGLRSETEYAASSPATLCEGDLLLILTDGIEECADPRENLFGIDATLEVVRANRHKPAQQIVEALYESVRQFSKPAPQLDDITAIVVKVGPAAV